MAIETKPSFDDAIRAYASQQRAERLFAPTVDVLVRYQLGKLSASEEERIQEYLMVTPEAARFVADLAILEEEAKGSELEDEQGRWQEFQRRLREQHEPESFRQVTRLNHGHYAVAASLLGAVLLSSIWGIRLREQLQRPQANLPVVSVYPVEELVRGGSAATKSVIIPASAQRFLVGFVVVPEEEFEDYRLTVTDGKGDVVWRQEEVERHPLGSVYILFSRSRLPGGRYEVELEGRLQEDWREVAIFPIEVSYSED